MKINNQIDGEHLYVMSDLHYNHGNVIKFNSRPFKDVEEMNNYIEGVLYSTLQPGDTIIDLGDLFWKTDETAMKRVMSLIPEDVNLYKIVGNHDNENLWKPGSWICQRFVAVADLMDFTNIRYKGRTINLATCHYPLISWNHKPRGAFSCTGHTHGNIDSYISSTGDLKVDCGFDGALAKKVGSFLIPFSSVYDHMVSIAGGEEFTKYVQNHCKEL